MSLWLIVVAVIVGLFQTSWPQASTPGPLQASHPHPSAAGLAKPRVLDARNSWEIPTSHSPGSWCLPFPRVGVEGGGSNSGSFHQPSWRRGPHPSTKATKCLGSQDHGQSMVRRGIHLLFQNFVFVQVMPARSLATFLSARRGPAVDCGTQSESKLRGLLGGQGWLWLDVGHCGSNLTCCPQGWDSSGSLRQLWGGREKCVPSPSLLWDSGV